MPSNSPPKTMQDLCKKIPPDIHEGLGTLSIGLCEFAAPGPKIRNASLFEPLWRTPDCRSQYYQLVRPFGMLTQNMEWVRLYRGATMWFVPLALARVLHLV